MYDVLTNVDEIRCRRRNITINSVIDTEIHGLSLKLNKCASIDKTYVVTFKDLEPSYSNVFFGKN